MYRYVYITFQISNKTRNFNSTYSKFFWEGHSSLSRPLPTRRGDTPSRGPDLTPSAPSAPDLAPKPKNQNSPMTPSGSVLE